MLNLLFCRFFCCFEIFLVLWTLNKHSCYVLGQNKSKLVQFNYNHVQLHTVTFKSAMLSKQRLLQMDREKIADFCVSTDLAAKIRSMACKVYFPSDLVLWSPPGAHQENSKTQHKKHPNRLFKIQGTAFLLKSHRIVYISTLQWFDKPRTISALHHEVPCHRSCIQEIFAAYQAADIFSIPLSLHPALEVSHLSIQQLD